ncbi:hypothetical protein FB45DRAFT_917229 [Roridomyces roridus]|uniref:Uncharacterized protein n=1 Tax=Roridomyces roridus TaxID=1738132 RepID=A0AAD7BUZ2_9AGAR|nr:hypothetical protein FB45DRAFT_917229 [Roridomyces roridus]
MSLYANHRVFYTRRVKAPLKNVLALLHDAEGIMRLSPVIESVSLDPATGVYTIVDGIEMPPFGFRTKVTYSAKINLHDEGMRAESDASGTLTTTNYTARAISEHETELVEEVNVKVSCRVPARLFRL